MADPSPQGAAKAEPAPPREWDAAEYNSLVLPHADWGRRVLDQLDTLGLAPDAVLLDAGVGTGRDIRELLARHRGYEVVAVDASRSMLTQAAENLDNDRVRFLHADLQQPLPLDAPVDAVISIATFHWIRDHATLFDNLHSVLKPGGHLIAECGGAGNLTALNAVVAQVTGRPPASDWEFADDDQTRRRLAEAGFKVDVVRLRKAPFTCASRAILERFLRTVILGAETDRLQDDAASAFVAEVADALATLDIDYVRLEMQAHRPA